MVIIYICFIIEEQVTSETLDQTMTTEPAIQDSYNNDGEKTLIIIVFVLHNHIIE